MCPDVGAGRSTPPLDSFDKTVTLGDRTAAFRNKTGSCSRVL